MEQDLSKSSTSDGYKSALQSISMMEDFVLGRYPYRTYGCNDLDDLQLMSNEQKTEIRKILGNSTEHHSMRYVGTTQGKKHIFESWTT